MNLRTHHRREQSKITVAVNDPIFPGLCPRLVRRFPEELVRRTKPGVGKASRQIEFITKKKVG